MVIVSSALECGTAGRGSEGVGNVEGACVEGACVDEGATVSGGFGTLSEGFEGLRVVEGGRVALEGFGVLFNFAHRSSTLTVVASAVGRALFVSVLYHKILSQLSGYVAIPLRRL